MTRLSCHRFRSNEVRLWLSVTAYNLGNLWRRLVLPKSIDNGSLTSLLQRLVKTGGCLILHARYYWLLLGGEPSDAAALWSQAGQDCGTIISSGISGSQTGTDFADEGDRGRKSVGGIGRRNGRFRLWHFQGWQNWPLPWALEAPNAESPAGHCIEKPLGVCYRSSAKS